MNGRWYERGEDGSECEWGRVLAWNPPDGLTLAWQLNAAFKFDPALVTEVEVKFVPLAARTARASSSSIGCSSASATTRTRSAARSARTAAGPRCSRASRATADAS